MTKEDSFKEKFKQAILSTVKVISEDNFSNPKNKKQLNEENLNDPDVFITVAIAKLLLFKNSSSAFKKTSSIVPFKKLYLYF